MSNVFSEIQWPVLIKYADYEELGYVDNAAVWETEVGSQGAYLNSADILVDSTGISYAISDAADGQKFLQQTQSVVSLDEILNWVRVHASMQGHCCVAKLYASSIEEIFVILKSLED